jgi:uncharacterized protein (DUF39 family)
MIKSLFRTLAALALVCGVAAIPVPVRASSIESEIELLRSDIKAEKVDLVKQVVKVEGARADAFWPVYRKYQLELDAIGDKRLALIKDYAANYTSMTDAKATDLVKQALDLQTQRTNLLKKYSKDFSKVLGAIDTARLLQLENLVMALIDVQIGAELPLVEKPTASQ